MMGDGTAGTWHLRVGPQPANGVAHRQPLHATLADSLMSLPFNNVEADYFATATGGTESFVVNELKQSGAFDIKAAKGGVLFRASLRAAMDMCLHSRIAGRVLMRRGSGDAGNADQLYDAVRALHPEAWVAEDQLVACRVTGTNSELRTTHFSAMRMKDAIVDACRDTHGWRPSVDTKHPDFALHARIRGPRADFSIDMCGRPLNQRGYRAQSVEAPIKETLAAALLRFGGWAGNRPFVDPMCGSGTLVIEALEMAMGTPAGMRRSFSFERWPFAGQYLPTWREVRDVSEPADDPPPMPIFYASDRDGAAVDATRANLKRAGHEEKAVVSCAPCSRVTIPWGAFVAVNPPYGERMDPRQVLSAHRDLFERAKAAGALVTIISLEEVLRQTFRWRPLRTLEVRNGPLRCQIAVYDFGER